MSHTKRKISLIALLFLSITSNSHCIGDESIEPIAIYHAFDKKFKDIKKKLTAIEKAGYSHIQISPCQEHRRSLPHTFIFDIKKTISSSLPRRNKTGCFKHSSQFNAR
jgi:hypothetical protein